MKKKLTWLLVLALALSCLLGVALGEETTLPAVGDKVSGFTVTYVDYYNLVDANVITYVHDKTGAAVNMYLNEDTNRFCSIGFRTPALNDTGVPHVFEHSTLDGSDKYPSKSLFFALYSQTYNTYMNAATALIGYTYYPFSSLSEAQLLSYSDCYLDAVFYPAVMDNEDIFLEEAWRYALNSADDDLRIEGTVYSEMSSNYSLDEAHILNTGRTLFPGSKYGNSTAGNPVYIPDMTWDDLKNYHNTYYHPSNSMTFLYGKIENPNAFLEELDTYFSAFDKKEFDFSEPEYTRIEGANVVEAAYGVASGTDTANSTDITLAFPLYDVSKEDYNTLALLCEVLNSDASAFQQSVKAALPAAKVGTYAMDYSPECALVIDASYVNRGDAETLRTLVLDAFNTLVSDQKFDDQLIDSVLHSNRITLLMTSENSTIGNTLVDYVYPNWFLSGTPYDHLNESAWVETLPTLNASGAFAAAAQKYVVDNPNYVLVTTYPEAGGKDAQEAALAEKLAAKKASMTEEEINALVEKTNTFNTNTDDPSEYVQKVQAVTVESLPEEIRMYDMTDETDADGVRHLYVSAAVDGLGQCYLLVNASAISQEDLEWYRLYSTLLGKMNTASYTTAEMAAQMDRYLTNYSMNTSIYCDETTGITTPYLRFSFSALDEDLENAYALLYETIYHTQWTDDKIVLSQVQQQKASIKATISGDPASYLITAAFANIDYLAGYVNYTQLLPYYQFLGEVEQMLSENPEQVMNKLSSIAMQLHNRYGAVTGYAGEEAGRVLHNAASDAFLQKLECTPVDVSTYQFELTNDGRAIILDNSTVSNTICASYEQLGAEKYTADLAVTSMLVNAVYLRPLLREQNGAYGAYVACGGKSLMIYTQADPKLAESYAIFESMPEMIKEFTITQEELDGYIMRAYSDFAMPTGELNGAYNVMVNVVNGIPQERTLEYLRQIKAMKAEDIQKYLDIYVKLLQNGFCTTAGSASMINANAELFTTITNPFSAVDVSQVEFTDAPEGSECYDAVRFAYENYLMAAVSDSEFGVSAPLTLGDEAAAMYVLVGGTLNGEEAVAYLASYSILPADLSAEMEMTREDMIGLMGNFLYACGMDTPTGEVENPTDTATRGELAELLMLYFSEE